MKAILRYSMRFPRIDLRIDPESTRMTLESTLPDTLQTGPEMASDASYPDLRYLKV